MEAQKVDMFLMTHSRYFEGHQMMMVKDKLTTIDDTKLVYVLSLNLKDPTTILIVSLLSGAFGIDRFMIGDTGLGVAKLLTCGGFGIWSIVDWFVIQGRTRELNFQNIQTLV